MVENEVAGKYVYQSHHDIMSNDRVNECLKKKNYLSDYLCKNIYTSTYEVGTSRLFVKWDFSTGIPITNIYNVIYCVIFLY